MNQKQFNDWPVGMSTGCFYLTPFLDCVETICGAGFHLIEICSHPAHLDYHDEELVKKSADAIRQAGLEPYSFHAPFGSHIDIMSEDSAKREEAVKELTQAVNSAAKLGVRNFLIHPGPEAEIRSEDDQLKRMENAVGILNQVHTHCRDLGMSLVLENMLPHLSVGRARDLLWIMGAMEQGDVGLCLDTGHAFLSGEISTVAQKLSGHLQMLHVNDNQSSRDDHLPPGEGSIQWRPLLEQLNGVMMLELAESGTMEETIAKVIQGRTFLQDVLRKMALV